MPQENEQVLDAEEKLGYDDDFDDTIVDGIFSDDDESTEATESEESESEETEEEEETEETEEESEDAEESESDDDDDYDSPANKKKRKDAEDGDEEEILTESEARKQAKLRGREAKELKAKLTERELELTKAAEERDSYKTKLDTLQSAAIKPEEHPDYVAKVSEVREDVAGVADLLPIDSPQLLTSSFGSFMAEYLKMRSVDGAERTELRNGLRASIVDSLKLSEVPYAELDDTEKKEHDRVITDVMSLLQRNVPKTRELQALHKQLSENAHVGRLTLQASEYKRSVDSYQPILEAVGNLTDDEIAANPHAVESIVAKRIKDVPEEAARLTKARQDVLEVLIGPKALTPEDIKRLESNGTDVKTFMAERQKSWEKKREKLVPLFVQGLMTRSWLTELSTKLEKAAKTEEDEDEDLRLLSKSGKKTSKKSGKPVRPKDRPDPLLSLGIDPDDD